MSDHDDPLKTGFADPDEGLVAEARGLIEAAARIVVLTGAGISTDSGIPDFRGPQGLWTTNPEAEKLATISAYLSDPEVRRRAWRRRMDAAMWRREPNAGHRALVDLERSGRLSLLVTQNVDGLHRAAGSAPDLLVEVHGNLREVLCVDCRSRWPVVAVAARVDAGEEDPPCEICGGILKPAVVFFGENLDHGDLERALSAAGTCDLLLVVGSSLAVYPINEAVPTAVEAGARLVILNGEPTTFDRWADVVLRASISHTLPRIVAGLA